MLRKVLEHYPELGRLSVIGGTNDAGDVADIGDDVWGFMVRTEQV